LDTGQVTREGPLGLKPLPDEEEALVISEQFISESGLVTRDVSPKPTSGDRNRADTVPASTKGTETKVSPLPSNIMAPEIPQCSIDNRKLRHLPYTPTDRKGGDRMALMEA
jgi:hypothetical protein